MLLKKTGFPQDEEFVLCTVTGINPHSVFCTLDEYGGRTGMIHISEIAPGRIKNIKEHVTIGKKIVTKVLQTNKERGHIDLSLRRVSEMQKRAKLNEIKQQLLAEKIIEHAAKQQGASVQQIFDKLYEKLAPEYGTIFSAFEQAAHDKINLENIIDKKLAKALTEAIKTRIKPPEVRISGTLQVSSYQPDGVQEVKDCLEGITASGAGVKYLGAGNYLVEVISEDYKTAEKKLREGLEASEKFAKKHDMPFKWERKEE